MDKRWQRQSQPADMWFMQFLALIWWPGIGGDGGVCVMFPSLTPLAFDLASLSFVR